MKTSVLLFCVLLLAGCASKDGFIDQQTFLCAPGQLVTIEAGLDQSTNRGFEGVDDQHTLIVLVGNNAHNDITVRSIRVDQVPDATAAYRFNSGFVSPNQTIEEGKDEEFKVPMSGRPIRAEVEAQVRSRPSIQLDVMVSLTSGDSYRCRFEIPVR